MTSNLSDPDEGRAWYEEQEDSMWMICPTCDGLGCDNWDEESMCRRCWGSGEVLRA